MSLHMRSSVDYIIDMRESSFRKPQPACFHAMAAASGAGKEALKQLLDKVRSEYMPLPLV
jgi:hypothetical protein